MLLIPLHLSASYVVLVGLHGTCECLVGGIFPDYDRNRDKEFNNYCEATTSSVF